MKPDFYLITNRSFPHSYLISITNNTPYMTTVRHDAAKFTINEAAGLLDEMAFLGMEGLIEKA